jgi:hypothetical protein
MESEKKDMEPHLASQTKLNIQVLTKDGIQLFESGNYVFRITSSKKSDVTSEGKPRNNSFKYINIVTTKDEYERKLSLHQYNPLLFLAPLTYRLSYLYGCLNREKGTSRKEIFMFWLRKIGDHQWIPWFSINPYVD